MMAELSVVYLLIFSWVRLASLAAGSVSVTASDKERLPVAYASPLNVDSELDCAVKELAWEYAKKILPRVSTENLTTV